MPFASTQTDLVNSTLEELGEFEMTSIMEDLQAYPIAERAMSKEGMDVKEGGDAIEGTLITDDNEQAQAITPGETRTVNINSGSVRWRAEWRHLESHYGLVRQFLAMNRGKRRVLDYAKMERMRSMQAWVRKFEELAWSVPSSTSAKEFNGIPYSIVESTTNTAGFNGGAPSGHTLVQNISPTTYSDWKNYTFEFTDITKADFMASLRTAIRKTRWRAAVKNPHKDAGRPRYAFYTCESNVNKFETLGEAQNENIGRDIDAFQDSVMIRKIPVVWVPELDAHPVLAAKTPFYGLDWATLKLCVLASEWNVVTKIDAMPYQPDTSVIYTDYTLQFVNSNRRRSFVATLAA